MLFRKQGAYRFSSQNHRLIVLPHHTLETERTGPGEVLGRAAARGLSCGCEGTPGAVSQMVLPGVLFDHQMSRKDHQKSVCCCTLQLPAHGLTKP